MASISPALAGCTGRGPTPLFALLLLLLILAAGAAPAAAQERVPRQVRTYIPPDQLVSFLPSTPFNQFVAFLNPIFERVTGRTIVDPEDRTHAIGISVAGMHFLDAFELVLEYNDLWYRTTEQFYLVERAETPDMMVETPGTAPRAAGGAAPQVLATPRTREIQISAIIFEVNQTEARQTGIDWNILFGEQTASGGGQGGAGGRGGEQDTQPRFFIRTERIFEDFDEYLIAPNVIEVSTITQLFRLLETTGVGRTLANPSITVQSAQQGRIQIGSDIPVTVRDFAGNTVTQFVSTGIIINVTPTLIERAPITDTLGGPTLDFIHLDVQVERSSGRPFGDGIAIDRSTANTQVLLLDREQTLIGGLFSTDDAVTRRGIPILKDLPGWFFGLRYLFGFTQRTQTERELMIVLQARTLDTLPTRNARPLPTELLEQFRRQTLDRINRFDRELQEQVPVPELREEGQ